jgi:ADP-ribosylglycohydrolase
MNKILGTCLIIALLGFSISCRSPDKNTEILEEEINPLTLTDEELHDKVLGMIVGSAIGDAMGAPTEMWSREMISAEYGFVQDLDSMVREVSPEGIWKANLPAGGTTDDTRWKKLAFEYLAGENPKSLDPKQFASHILAQFDGYLAEYKTIESKTAEPFEANSLKVGWLQEWAKAARPYVKNDLNGYQIGLSTFYGGEMVCAGLLYAPAIGAFFPDNPEKAYAEAFKLALFDIGYAKDITALSAAMTSAAMKKGATQSEVLDVLRSVDPQKYFEARLVGRSSYRILQTALQIVKEGKAIYDAKFTTEEERISQAQKWSPEYLQPTFEKLDQHLQDMPFHSGEIHLQVLTAMIFADFDFEKTLIFLVNYGRDNDTTAAIAGGILGAYYGFDRLPEQMKKQVLEVNKKELDIDMVELAENMSENLLRRYR